MRRTVLLVEDNATDEKLTVRALSRSGVAHTVLVARDGVEALGLLHGAPPGAARFDTEMPALVLLDLKLPRIDGLELLRRLRDDARTRLVPVVMLTASRLDDDVHQSYLYGANAYVRKPVDFTEFTHIARTLLAFWLDMNERPSPRARA